MPKEALHTITVLVAVLVAAAGVIGAIVTANESLIRSKQAQQAAQNAQEQLLLGKELVCSESHRGVPCRALFDRLARDISPEQRLTLACASLEQFKPNRLLTQILRENDCAHHKP